MNAHDQQRARFEAQLAKYKPTKLICGMIPWMFWTLSGVILFTIFGPFITVIFL